MNDDQDKQAPGKGDDDALLAEVRARMEHALSYYSEDHKEAMTDLKFLAGDQWPEQVVRERDIDGRPCLTINKLPTFAHQVTNDQRMNVPGIMVSPVDGNADVETAKVMKGLIRHIEYSSNADVAYDTAVTSAAQIGCGYWRLVTDYCDPKSFDQDIRFQRIRNAFTVYFDPSSQEADGSDAQFVIITSKIPRWEFRRQYPKADLSQENDALPRQTGDDTTKNWVSSDQVRVAEYYRIELTDDELVLLPDGSTEFKSVLTKALVEVPEDAMTRPTQRKKVMWYKVTAYEVLERTEIKCDWIPVFPVYGDELVIDDKVIHSGIVRNARDAQSAYNFWITSATEEVALRAKTPWVGAEGQFEGLEADWEMVNRRPLNFIEYKPVSLDGVLAPPPQRQPMADIPVGALQMLMHANDNIKATTGLFDSSIGARGSATSGVQERQQQRQGDMANFHFTDNLHRTVRHCGRCLISMIPHYYDGQRIVRVMGEDMKISHAEINKPIPQEKQELDEQGNAIRTIENDLTIGKYDLTVKAGPSYDTLRQEALENMVELGGKWPKLMDVAGDKVIEAMDWPGSTEIAERVKKTIPPQITGDEQAAEANMVQTPQGPMPKEAVGQAMAQMMQQMQQMAQELEQAQNGVAQAQVKAQSDMEKARMDNETALRVAEINAVSRSDVEELKGYVQLLLAKIQPPPQLTADAMTEGDGAASSGAEQPGQPPQG